MAVPLPVITVGTSAGGMPALEQLVAQLPARLPAAVLVVQHFAPESNGQALVERLARHTGLRCYLATDGLALEAGALYLAPPDRHLLVKDGTGAHLLVTKGPRENHFRPAIDALFRSAAVAFGPAVVGVVLTGMLYDGTAGLEFIKRCGGTAVVQDPTDAEFASMPTSALQNVAVDHVVPLREMGALLVRLTSNGHVSEPPPGVPEDLRMEAAIAERVVGNTEAVAQLGHLVAMTCPDCGGNLWEMGDGQVLRYRCHTGHAFTAQALLKLGQESLEESLWVALRMMEERKNLLSSLATRGTLPHGGQQEERIEEIKKHINRLREFLLAGNGPAGTPRPE